MNGGADRQNICTDAWQTDDGPRVAGVQMRMDAEGGRRSSVLVQISYLEVQ